MGHIILRPAEAKSVVEKLPGLGQGSRLVRGMDVAERVREGSEAEARRVVGSLPVSQIAIKNALCGSSFWEGRFDRTCLIVGAGLDSQRK